MQISDLNYLDLVSKNLLQIGGDSLIFSTPADEAMTITLDSNNVPIAVAAYTLVLPDGTLVSTSYSSSSIGSN